MPTYEPKYQFSFSPGLSVGTRLPYNLVPQHIPIDSRSLSDDLKYIYALAPYVNFFNANGSLGGTWETFISNNPQAALAGFASIDLERIKKQGLDLLQQMGPSSSDEQKEEAFNGFLGFTIELFSKLYAMVENAVQWEDGSFITGIQAKLIDKIAELLPSFNRLSELYGNDALKNELHLLKQKIDPAIADLLNYQNKSTLQNELANSVETLSYKEKADLMKEIYDDLYNLLNYIVYYINENMESLVEDKVTNRPYFAVLVSFFSLLKELREYLNTFTKRHLDFYYKKVLQQHQGKGVADSTFVLLELKQGLDPFVLPQGSEMLAGKDAAGKDLVYTTDTDVRVGATAIKNLYNLFVERNENIPAGNERFVSAIYASVNPMLGKSGAKMDLWPLLGCTPNDPNFPDASMSEAQLGFSIASSELLLGEGQRNVLVKFYIDPTTFPSNLVQYVMKTEHRNEADAVYRLFSKAFNASITGAAGWIPLAYSFLPAENNSVLNFSFAFAPSDPAVTPYSESVHTAGMDTTLPVLRFMLNTYDAPYFAYSLLKGMLVKNIEINVEVKGMLNLDLFSNEGKLSAAKPFFPLGINPMPGAYLLVGSAEAFSKNLDSLQVKVTWDNLPPNGFTEQYTGYPDPPANDSFIVGASLLQDGTFSPEENNQQQFRLFTNASADPNDQSLLPYTIFDDIDLSALHQRPTWDSSPLPDYAPGVNDGYLKFELYEPEAGFGSMAYASALTNTIMENSARANNFWSKLFPKLCPPEPPLPLPLAPFTPEAVSVSMDYTSTLDSNRLPASVMTNPPFQFFYNHPFGTATLHTQSQISSLTLLPDYKQEAYLYIGMDTVTPQTDLSLFFNLTGESFYSTDDPPQVQWGYLSYDGWANLSSEKVVSDSTESFLCTGIVNVNIPLDISNENRCMPGTLFWLSASVQKEADVLSPAYNINTQAVPVTWKNEGNDPHHLDEPLPAKSIVSFRQPTPGVQSIYQPLPSTGGVPPESMNDFYVRISERISHKERAILPIDYERLILREFPEIYMVKCFPNSTFTESYKPGNILIILISKDDRHNLHNILSPKSNLALLKNVMNFISSCSPPGITIHVHNPVYEEVKICCSIKLHDGFDNGLYLAKLNTDLEQFISPWLFNDTSEVELGGSVSTSEMIGFIREQPHVDFVTGLSIEVTMNIDKNGEDHFRLQDSARPAHPVQKNILNNNDSEKIIATFPWSVFVTSSYHQIKLIENEDPVPPEPRGIGNLVINDDFISVKEVPSSNATAKWN